MNELADIEANEDALFEAQEIRQAMIDAEVDSFLKDDDSIELLISENADVVWNIIKSGKDVQDKLNTSIQHWVECFVESEYE